MRCGPCYQNGLVGPPDMTAQGDARVKQPQETSKQEIANSLPSPDQTTKHILKSLCKTLDANISLTTTLHQRILMLTRTDPLLDIFQKDRH